MGGPNFPPAFIPTATLRQSLIILKLGTADVPYQDQGNLAERSYCSVSFESMD